MRRRLWLLAAAILSSGCGGIISTVFIVQGTIGLAGARAANAENLATYEYVSAEAYLKKAREAHSYADFEHSLRFARLATERAATARTKALEANKPMEPTPGSDLPPPDTMAPPPQEPPPPAYQPPPPGYEQPPPGYQPPPPGYAPQQPPPPAYPPQPQTPPEAPR
ncbi:MAG: DUF4398 domain-containing protein [Deltaproteobacteria bacterium]|nr:DUF4398 domain-containing protein [Deltaproteobacteria bacterium]